MARLNIRAFESKLPSGEGNINEAFEELMISIAEGNITPQDAQEHLRERTTINAENKIAYFTAIINKDKTNTNADRSSEIRAAGRIKSDEKTIPLLEKLYLTAVSCKNDKTHNAGIGYLSDMYKNSPDDLMRVYKHIVETEIENGYQTNSSAIKEACKLGIKNSEYADKAIKICAIDIAKKGDGSDNDNSHKEGVFIKLCSVIVGHEIGNVYHHSENVLKFSLADFKKMENKPKADRLGKTINNVLDNSLKFPNRMTQTAFLLGLELAYKVPDYRTGFRKSASGYITRMREDEVFWYKEADARIFDTFMEKTGAPVIERFSINKDIMLLPQFRLMEDKAVYERAKNICEIIAPEFLPEIKKLLCDQVVRKETWGQNRHYAFDELTEKYGFTLNNQEDRKMFLETAEEISRKPYAEMLVEQYDNLVEKFGGKNAYMVATASIIKPVEEALKKQAEESESQKTDNLAAGEIAKQEHIKSLFLG